MLLLPLLNTRIDYNVLPKALKSLSVSGRFESIPSSLGFVVVVDYAHTPDALKNVLETAIELKPVNIITVFGAGVIGISLKDH